MSVFTQVYAQSFQIFGDAFSVPTVSNASCSNADTCFSLTANSNWQNGAVWDLDLIDLSNPFDATFCMFIGGSDNGADGFAFVIRDPSANVYGEDGGSLGYGSENGLLGISPSVGIEFDSFYNSEFFDIQEDHTQLVLNGQVASAPAVPAVSLLPSGANVEDNNFHNARIVWDPILQQLSMYFDGFLRFTYTNDIINSVFGGNPNVLWGFTASTGGLSNLQQICFPKVLIELPDYEICEQDSVLISYPMENIQSYTWTDPNGAIIIDWNDGMGVPLTETSFYASESGLYTLTVEFNNQTYSDDLLVTLIPLPESIDLELCTSSSNLNLFDLFTTNNIPTNGTWSGPSALSGAHLGTFNPGSNLEGVYIYESNSSNICPSDNQVTISYHSVIFNPTIDLIPCTETQYELEANPLMSNGQANFSYTWTSTTANLANNQNQSTATINANATVQLEITSMDAFACEYDTILNLTFLTSPQFSLGSDLMICSGENITVNAPGNWSSFQWSDGSSNSSINLTSSGEYWCEVSSGQNCIFRDTIELTVTPVPTITLSSFDTISCLPFTLNFNANVDNPNATLSWDFGDGFTSSSTSNVIHTYNNAGVYDLLLTASIGNSCEGSLFLDDAIHVLSLPHADFAYNVISNDGSQIKVEFFNNSVNYTSFLWDFDGDSTSVLQNPVTFFDISAQSEFVVNIYTTNDYCSDSMQQIIDVPGQLIYYVPNTFTPDGNLFNNYFEPVFTEGYVEDSYHLRIYNRWGEIVFESFDPKSGWDGTYGGKLAKEDIYVWIIEFTEKGKNEKRQITGHVNLMK